MKYIKLFENFLLEGRIEDLSQKYSDKISDYEILTLKDYSQNSSSNFQWLLKHYSNDMKNYKENITGVNILLDVLDDYFKRYLRIKQNLPIEKRDINSLKSTKELINVVDDYNDYDTMREDSGLDILLENEKWVVFIPKTFEASNKWGWGRFCTSNDEDYFKYHNINNNSLVYVMHKFDYTKNIVIECFPKGEYQIWNYQDDNTFGGEGKVYQELSDIDDGYLNVDRVLYSLPDIDEDDLLNHLVDLISIYNANYINDILGSDFDTSKEYVDDEDVKNYIEDNNINLYDIRSDIRDSM